MSTRNQLLVAAVIAGLAFGSALPAFAHGAGPSYGGSGYGWGWGGGMGPGMMGPGMMGPGQGHGPGPGYGMGPGMMGPGQGYGPGPAYGMGQGMIQPLREDLSTADAKHMIEHRLTWQGNPNLKLGNVEEKDADTIVAEIVTTDGSVVQRLQINRHTGSMQPVQ